jgi:vacuolar protein sorting-associated protein 35
MLITARKQFGNSGKERMRYLLPPLVFKAYDLSYRYKKGDDVDNNWEKLFKFCFQTINALIKAELPAELTFRLFLQGAIALCEIDNENTQNITYEFISQVRHFKVFNFFVENCGQFCEFILFNLFKAISLYDEEIAKNKYSAITLIIGTCQSILHMFNSEECDSLRQDCTVRAAKLLKKPDQCRAVALCSNLFWNCKPRKNGDSVILLIQKFTSFQNSEGLTH